MTMFYVSLISVHPYEVRTFEYAVPETVVPRVGTMVKLTTPKQAMRTTVEAASIQLDSPVRAVVKLHDYELSIGRTLPMRETADAMIAYGWKEAQPCY